MFDDKCKLPVPLAYAMLTYIIGSIYYVIFTINIGTPFFVNTIVGDMEDLGLFPPSILFATRFPFFLEMKEKSVNSLLSK